MTDGPPLRIRIDTAALSANWRRLNRLSGAANCAAVVKADAYGLGLDVAVPVIASAGCTVFFVATPDEGVRVRRLASEATIYVLDGLVGQPTDYAAHQLRPVLGNLDELAEWQAFRQSANGGSKPGAALHIDTGMNRLGLSFEEARNIAGKGAAELIDSAGITLIISHLACADTPDHPLNARQIERFANLRALFPDVPGSLANSPGIFLDQAAHHDLVRPGIALYGGGSHPNAKMYPVVSVLARILQVRTVKAGESIGYGGAQTVDRDSRIAILAAGYGDGYLRSAGSGNDRPGAQVAIGKHLAPLIGRVSMDLVAVDVTDLPTDIARRGGETELFGPNLSIDAVARGASTIGYELLTGLSQRAVRETFDGGPKKV
ncbi:MAG: alanine racemase [Alphaproteobacteria bacterium]